MWTPRSGPWFAACCLLAMPALALAQTSSAGFSLDRLRPAPTTEDGLALSLPRTLGHLRPGVALTLDYAHQPLVLSEPGDDLEGAIVKHRLVGHLQAALGLGDRSEVFVHVPVTFVQTGEEPELGGVQFPDPHTAAFGDVTLGGSLRLVGDDLDPFQLGVMASLTLPSGGEKGLSGDDGVGAGGALLGVYHFERFSLGANAGAQYRPGADYGTAAVGTELTFGLGGYLQLTENWLGLSELQGVTTLRGSQAFTSEGTPLQWLGGVRWTTPARLVLTGGVGIGLTRAVGVPDVRALLGLGWPPVRPPLEPPDRDKDGVLDPKDACVDDAEDMDGFEDEDGCPDPDNDRDGVLDTADACPREAEDVDGFEDQDGCPEADNDQDGLLDADDDCPLHAEDPDQFQDEDGCPDPDNDQDGVLDTADACPRDAEDIDGFEDQDGCPEIDNDKDGVPDAEDHCPRAPGPASSHGCPKAVRIDRSQIRILQRIEFETGRAELRPSAAPILQEVAQALNANPQIRLVRIEGHTDNRGTESYNETLSQRRAEAVLRFLVDEGITPERLIAKGFGESRPLVPNDSAPNMQTNRRVEFHILDPDPNASGDDEETGTTKRTLDAAGGGALEGI